MKKIVLALAFLVSLTLVGCNNQSATPKETSKKEMGQNSALVKKLEGVRKGYGKIVKAALKSEEMDKVGKVVGEANKYQEKLSDTIDGVKAGKLNKKETVKNLEGVRKGYGKIVKAALKFDNMKVVQAIVDASNKYQEKLSDTIDTIK